MTPRDSVVLGMGMEWQTALGAVFVSGILFLIIALTGLRQWILEAIPLYLKRAITAGIGAFLAIIGFSGAGLYTSKTGEPRKKEAGGKSVQIRSA